MMKEFGFIPFILLLIAGNASSQTGNYNTSKDFKVIVSEPFKTVKTSGEIYLKNEDFALSFNFVKPGVFVIQSFDATDMHQIASAENQFQDRKSQFESIINLDERFYCLYSIYDKSEKLQKLNAIEIDPKTAKFKDEGRILLSIDGKVTGKYQNGIREIDKFDTEFSRDGKHIMIHFRMKPDQRKDDLSYDNIGLYVFDASLNKLYGDIREMKYTEAQMDIVDYCVDNEGVVICWLRFIKVQTFLEKSETTRSLIIIFN